MAQKLGIRKLFQEAGLAKCTPGNEPDDALRFLQHIRTVMAQAGGDAPAPMVPTSPEIVALESLSDNDLLLQLYEQREARLQKIQAWQAVGLEISKRLPALHLAERPVTLAVGLGEQVEWTTTLNLVRANHTLPDDPDPVSPVIGSAANRLRAELTGAHQAHVDMFTFELESEGGIENRSSPNDIHEVSNYVAAMNYGLERLREFPISLRLIREIHARLVTGIRGGHKNPEEFRTSQNWIGGTGPGNAVFVPPPAQEVLPCLGDLETFIHDEAFPPLLKAGMIHAQFETIHPFLDGNGRMGRLLITFILCHERVPDKPLLYLSLFFKKNRQEY